MSALSSLLERLSPMAMMEDNGTEKARIAISVLEKKASQEPLAAALAECGGLRILVQTMVLHPEPPLRHGACTVLSAALHEKEHLADFLLAAQAARLPQGLQRVLNEEDRKAKPKDGEQATDPDLLLRRAALPALARCIAELPELLDDPVTSSTVICVAGSADSDLRRGGLRLALSLARNEATLPKVIAAVDASADKVAPALLRAWDDVEVHDGDGGDGGATVRDGVLQLALLLRSSDGLRDQLAWHGALEAVAVAREATDAASGAAEGTLLAELHEWLSLAPAAPPVDEGDGQGE
jgi:hypothetical protein